MFSSLGWPEIAVLLLVALVIFGPDRLPGAVKQAGSALRSARETLTGARKQMNDEFGDVMPNFDPAMLNPKAFVKKHLLDDLDLDDEPVKPAVNAMEAATPKPQVNGSTTAANGSVDLQKPANGSVDLQKRVHGSVDLDKPVNGSTPVPAEPFANARTSFGHGPSTATRPPVTVFERSGSVSISGAKSPVIVSAGTPHAARSAPPVEPVTPYDDETT